MAPAVFVHKKNGEVRLCVDYRELNKRTVKDANPLPRPDEVQDRLMGSTVFSTLDIRSGYWQLPVHVDDQPKTAFCPGPGFGLFQFRRMPFRLSGAPSSFQRLMNTICGDLSSVTTYLDDLLVHSKNIHEHVKYLGILFQHMHNAGEHFVEANARLVCLLLLTWVTSFQQLAHLQILKKYLQFVIGHLQQT